MITWTALFIVGVLTVLVEYRAAIYVVALAFGTWLSWQNAIAHSQAAYDAGDLSAFAWTGFAPFIIPLMVLDAAMYVVPVVIVVEIGLFFWRYRRIM